MIQIYPGTLARGPSTMDGPWRRVFNGPLNLHDELAMACERGQMWLAYQPIIDNDGGVESWPPTARSAEVLLRWNHPVLGPQSPAGFIPILEDNGQIHVIGEWVLRQACFQVKRWQDLGRRIGQFSVNVSPKQLCDADFTDKVRRALHDSGLSPQTLALEVTENVLVEQTERTIDGLQSLARLGIGLHIDDFGTGFSSIAYLKRLPLTALKIDRTFVTGIARDTRDLELVQCMIQLARIFGLETVAEGVETATEAEIIRSLGVTRLQGFHFGAGVAADEFDRLYLQP